MTDNLTLSSNTTDETWCPNSIAQLETHLSYLIDKNQYFSREKAKGIRKNISYSLQYIEFLYRITKDIKTTSVIDKQNIKSFLIHGTAIIEAISNFVVISTGYEKTTKWKSVTKNTTNEYKLNLITYKNEIEIFEKLESEISITMTFDQLIKKIESKKLFGQNFPIYSKIKPLRQLRNKIHIHDSENSGDTDWYNFNTTEYKLIKEVLFEILKSDLFNNTIFNGFEFLGVYYPKKNKQFFLKFNS